MASLFLKSFQWYGKLTFEIELIKIYGLLPNNYCRAAQFAACTAEPQHGSQATPNQIHETKTHKAVFSLFSLKTTFTL